MSFFNGSALAVMLKSMFPAPFARIEQMEADGTLDKIQATATTLATNGTLEALTELAQKIDRNNRLLEIIAEGMKADGKLEAGPLTGTYIGPGVHAAGTDLPGQGEISASRISTGIVEPGSDTGAAGHDSFDRAGMSGTNGPD